MSDYKYSMLQDDWEVADGVFTSPPPGRHDEQVLIFADRLKNGSIAADVTPLKSQKTRNEQFYYEADLILRYGGSQGYYLAGTGAFDSKFFVAKVLPGPYFQHCDSVGQRSAVAANKTYRLRLEFFGSRIELFENDVSQIVVYDENYSIGQVGLRTFRTQARFENVRVVKQRPMGFVVMPFASELDFVHRIIHEVVESYGIRCVRADQIYVSRPVVEDLKEQIAAADLVIVDFTGKNPNVYYEAGLADAWKKDWIVLAQSSDDLTFDVRHIRTIRYSNTMGADVKLREDLWQALEALGHRRTAKTD